METKSDLPLSVCLILGVLLCGICFSGIWVPIDRSTSLKGEITDVRIVSMKPDHRGYGWAGEGTCVTFEGRPSIYIKKEAPLRLTKLIGKKVRLSLVTFSGLGDNLYEEVTGVEVIE